MGGAARVPAAFHVLTEWSDVGCSLCDNPWSQMLTTGIIFNEILSVFLAY